MGGGGLIWAGAPTQDFTDNGKNASAGPVAEDLLFDGGKYSNEPRYCSNMKIQLCQFHT